jgi:18S rRNA (guanine1575-N7)-methyltransferase
MQIQSIMAERCIQLLNLKDDCCLLLDIGCGSGLSGDMINEYGYAWVGLDVSPDMLSIKP